MTYAAASPPACRAGSSQRSPVTVIEKIPNHTSGTFRGVTEVYQQDDFLPEMRAALEARGRHVVSLGKPGEAAKVIRLDAMA